MVIDHLYSHFHRQSKIGIACLYADYKDQASQTLEHILGSFLHQLLTRAKEPIPVEVIQKLQDIQLQRAKVGTEDTLALLKLRLQQLDCAFICIDALDELEPKVRQKLLNILRDLLGTVNTCLFLTGRDHIEGEVRKCLQEPQGYTVTVSASQQDIEQFIRQQLEEDRDLNPEAMDEGLAKDIVDKIITMSQGMYVMEFECWNVEHTNTYCCRFLLPSLHIKIILEMPTKSKRREALETLPTDLYDAFQGIITRIRECHRAGQAELGMRVLMWLHFAHRPLKLAELQHALAVEKSHTEFDADNIPPKKALLDSCLGLVVVDEETSTVRFVHYTLQEYFRNDSRAEFPNGYTYIAETCLTYLNFGQLKQHCLIEANLDERIREYMFLEYAARYWGTYIQRKCNDGLKKLVEMIVDHESGCPPCAIQALYHEIDGWPYLSKKFSGIHAIAYFGLGEIMAYFCKAGKYKELKDDNGQTPLSWAAKYGHESTVQSLVQTDGVNINTMDSYGQTPLILAVEKGHEAIVQLLVERDDADINIPDWNGRTPLIYAARIGHEAVVRILIGGDDVGINTTDSDGWTPLSWAAKEGHEAIVQLLVEREDVDINTKDNRYERTPLSWAAEEGHETVVRLLVERADVDINTKDKYDNRTPLSWAAQKGHEAVVQLLIKRDNIDINTKSKDYWQTPLSYAALNGHEGVVRLLIGRDDIDINIIDNIRQTPLFVAAYMGHEAIVRLLVGRGDVDINIRDDDGRTPLSWAAARGHEAILQLLVERGDIDINTKDNNGRTPLSWAAENGYEAIIQLLVERGATGDTAGVEVQAAGSSSLDSYWDFEL